MSHKRRRHSREFKLAVLERLETADSVVALARELGVQRELMYRWRRLYAAGGSEALREFGAPRRAIDPALGADPAPPARGPDTQRRIAELERKVGQQALELDFFRAALRQVRERRRRNGGPGGTASSR